MPLSLDGINSFFDDLNTGLNSALKGVNTYRSIQDTITGKARQIGSGVQNLADEFRIRNFDFNLTGPGLSPETVPPAVTVGAGGILPPPPSAQPQVIVVPGQPGAAAAPAGNGSTFAIVALAAALIAAAIWGD